MGQRDEAIRLTACVLQQVDELSGGNTEKGEIQRQTLKALHISGEEQAETWRDAEGVHSSEEAQKTCVGVAKQAV